MNAVSEISKAVTISAVKDGDRVHITYKKPFRSFEPDFVVSYKTDKALVYGCSITCDGYSIPYMAIEKIEIVQ